MFLHNRALRQNRWAPYLWVATQSLLAVVRVPCWKGAGSYEGAYVVSISYSSLLAVRQMSTSNQM
jgi:hypothetical protein